MRKVLITGAAGFIGFHTTKKMLADGYEVTGLDNLIPYYDVELKKSRLVQLGIIPASIRNGEIEPSTLFPGFHFLKEDLANREAIAALFRNSRFDYVIHLAAQAGVRESITNPYQYIDSNINGLITILEGCRHSGVRHLVFASSSSVYGNNEKVPFAETDPVDHPISLYAATKKSGELMAYTYSHLFNVPITALRFFTVYGPWGRPDMAYYKFAMAIRNGETIEVFNHGDLFRDFTYIDDVVNGITKLLPDQYTSKPPFSVLNIGNSSPVKLMDFIGIIEELMEKKAILKYLPMQPGDVYQTYADVSMLDDRIGFKPETGIRQGLERFVSWFRKYYKLN